MKNKQNNSLHASALQITLRIILISFFAALLTFAAMPAGNQFKQKPTRADMALQSAQHRAAPSKSSANAKQRTPRKSARVEISASRQRVHGREIAGFSARQALTTEEENLTPPAGLKPVEQEAWQAMARRGATGLESFYPARYGEPFVVEGKGVRVALRPLGGANVTAQVDNSQVTYRNAYPETDSMHVVNAGRSEEFLFLQSECAPREFAYELSEVSADTRIALVNGEVRFTNKLGQGVKIEAPWLVEANGALRSDAVHWEVDRARSAAGPQRLRLVVAEGLRYPVMIDPSWTFTGGLNGARYWHTATSLSSGQVLVAGGTQDGVSSLSSAELYNPATGSWTPTGSLHTARYQYTATLLSSGKVLVAAGATAAMTGAFTSTAELYDPSTGTWTATGNLVTARADHTATLLSSGKVLVAGGNGSSGVLSSAEVYDPTTGIWSSAGNMSPARGEHTATLLPNGQVLVAGGSNNAGYLSNAELYNPATNGWAATGNLVSGRHEHTATLLPNGKVLVAGGQNAGGQLNSAELYDPVAGTWSATASLGTSRRWHTATLLVSGKVLVTGGFGGSGFGDVLSSAELYDPTTTTWSATASLNAARELHTATLLPSGRVLVAGGNGINSSFTAELYDPGGFANSDPNANTITNTITNAFTNSYSYGDSYSDRNTDTYSYCNSNDNRD